jgi:hypothetical protein
MSTAAELRRVVRNRLAGKSEPTMIIGEVIVPAAALWMGALRCLREGTFKAGLWPSDDHSRAHAAIASAWQGDRGWLGYDWRCPPRSVLLMAAPWTNRDRSRGAIVAGLMSGTTVIVRPSELEDRDALLETLRRWQPYRAEFSPAQVRDLRRDRAGRMALEALRDRLHVTAAAVPSSSWPALPIS